MRIDTVATSRVRLFTGQAFRWWPVQCGRVNPTWHVKGQFSQSGEKAGSTLVLAIFALKAVFLLKLKAVFVIFVLYFLRCFAWLGFVSSVVFDENKKKPQSTSNITLTFSVDFFQLLPPIRREPPMHVSIITG